MALPDQRPQRPRAGKENQLRVNHRSGHQADVERLIWSRAETQAKGGPSGFASKKPAPLRAQAIFFRNALGDYRPSIPDTGLSLQVLLSGGETNGSPKIGLSGFRQ